MSLRSLGSLLTRRFSPLRNPSAQAASSLGIGIQKAPGSSSSAGRSARSFNTLRDLAIADGVYGAAATAAVFAGLVAGVLYFNKDTENSAGEVTGKETGKKIIKEAYVSREEAIKLGFVGEGGVVNWHEYFDYVNSQTNYGGMPLYDKKVSVKEVTTGGKAVEQEDVVVDEATMKARFEDWMKEYGRSYRTEEEKARRYEIFKEVAISADKANASKRRGARVAAPNGLADWTDEEFECLDNDFDWDTYVDHMTTWLPMAGILAMKSLLLVRQLSRGRNYWPSKQKEGAKGTKARQRRGLIEEEKARRCEIFKDTAMSADKANASNHRRGVDQRNGEMLGGEEGHGLEQQSSKMTGLFDDLERECMFRVQHEQTKFVHHRAMACQQEESHRMMQSFP